MVLSIRRSLVERDGAVSPHTHLVLAVVESGDRQRRPARLLQTASTQTPPGAPHPTSTLSMACRPGAPPGVGAPDERTPGRGSGVGDNVADRNGGREHDAGGHTYASACLLAARAAASLTPAFATHRPCRAITPHTLDA